MSNARCARAARFAIAVRPVTLRERSRVEILARPVSCTISSSAAVYLPDRVGCDSRDLRTKPGVEVLSERGKSARSHGKNAILGYFFALQSTLESETMCK